MAFSFKPSFGAATTTTTATGNVRQKIIREALCITTVSVKDGTQVSFHFAEFQLLVLYRDRVSVRVKVRVRNSAIWNSAD